MTYECPLNNPETTHEIIDNLFFFGNKKYERVFVPDGLVIVK